MTMRLLFVCSGRRGISPIVSAQADSLKLCGIEVNIFPITGGGVSGYLRSIPKLRKHVKKFRPDITHAHYSLCGITAWLAGAKPLVTSLMGSDVNGSKMEKIIIRFFASKLWNATIVKSPDMKSNLRIDSTQLIPNGVNLDKFHPMDRLFCKKELGLCSDKWYILFAADPVREVKNFPLAKAAFSELHIENCKLISLGNIPHIKIPQYINACNVLILTSIREGSPNIIKEAMACNVPVVSTPVGDTKWLFGNIEGHYLAQPTPNDVAAKLEEALKFAGRTKGRERLIELGLDSRAVAKRLVKLYERVVRR